MAPKHKGQPRVVGETAYRVLVGLSYPAHGRGDEKRAEPGDIVTDLPAGSLTWLLADGYIEPVDGA